MNKKGFTLVEVLITLSIVGIISALTIPSLILNIQKKYWANENEVTGTAGHYLKDNNIHGLITLNAFGCGPDSLMIERIMRKAKEAGKPLLSLTIDEHTGEAGFITRLEAFIDMLYRKKRSEINEIKLLDYDYSPQTNICDTVLSEIN